MYNVLHAAILGGYAGPVTADNFWDWRMNPPKILRRIMKHYYSVL
jgi:hypothetical protein